MIVVYHSLTVKLTALMAVGNFLLFVIVDSLLLLELPINSLQPLKFEGFNLNSFEKDDSCHIHL